MNSKDYARKTLETLRWKEDMAVENPFGEFVWLGPHHNDAGERIGITDCCHVRDPCERHSRFVLTEGGEADG